VLQVKQINKYIGALKKKKTNFQMGTGAKSYVRKGFLIYEEMRKYLTIYEDAVI
jgi:hypothetical protein